MKCNRAMVMLAELLPTIDPSAKYLPNRNEY